MIGVLPDELLEYIDRIEGGDMIERYDEISKFRLIPFSSLGKQNGMLVGFKVEKIVIKFKEKEKNVDDIIVGIYSKKFTENNKYNAIIGLDVIDVSDEEKIKI